MDSSISRPLSHAPLDAGAFYSESSMGMDSSRFSTDAFASVIDDDVEVKFSRQRSESEILPLLPQFVPLSFEAEDFDRARGSTLRLKGERGPRRSRRRQSREADDPKLRAFRASVRARRDCVSPELEKFAAELGKSQKDIPSGEKPRLQFKRPAAKSSNTTNIAV